MKNADSRVALGVTGSKGSDKGCHSYLSLLGCCHCFWEYIKVGNTYNGLNITQDHKWIYISESKKRINCLLTSWNSHFSVFLQCTKKSFYCLLYLVVSATKQQPVWSFVNNNNIGQMEHGDPEALERKKINTSVVR